MISQTDNETYIFLVSGCKKEMLSKNNKKVNYQKMFIFAEGQ